MTLMPVTRISRFRRLVDEPARAWIGIGRARSTGPRSSIGSPMTFMMRPSVAGPTGTGSARRCRNGWPRVSPRSRPSRSCGRCFRPGAAPLRGQGGCRCSRFRAPTESRAVRLRRSTSTTAPMTWLIRVHGRAGDIYSGLAWPALGAGATIAWCPASLRTYRRSS
jgi:hypothetical protein